MRWATAGQGSIGTAHRWCRPARGSCAVPSPAGAQPPGPGLQATDLAVERCPQLCATAPVVAVALTIAGSDPAGGAGIQADLKTFHQHGVYGAAVITLLTVQNTQRLSRVVLQPAELVQAQLVAVLEDLPVAAVKTGALGDAATVHAVADACRKAGLRPVVDPVRVSKAGAALLADEARDALVKTLLPQCALITPNLDEAAWLTSLSVADLESQKSAAKWLLDRGAGAVLMKGGHRAGAPDDVLFSEGKISVLQGQRVSTPHTHGVGCTLSAAICAHLAQGQPLEQACRDGKAWLQRAIARAPGIGQGQGAVDHLTPLF